MEQIQIIGNRKGNKLDDLIREASNFDLVREAYEEVMGLRKKEKKVEKNLENKTSTKTSRLDSGLYIAGDFTKVDNLELNGRSVVKYENGNIEKVVDGFDWYVKALCMEK